MRLLFKLLKRTYIEWTADKGPRLGAALAYYTVFSLAPLLVIVIASAGLFFGQEAVQGQLMGQISGLLGKEGGEAVSSMIASAWKNDGGIFATVMGVLTLLFGATGVFIQLQDALDTIWGVKSTRSEGFLGFIKSRWLSLTMVLGIGFLLLVSLIVSAAISFIAPLSLNYLPFSGELLQLLNFCVSLLMTAGLFALMFKYLPNVAVQWRDVWMGALVSACLFAIGRHLIGIYLGRAAVSSSFGAAGSLVIILLWSYYSAQILLFGAEYTQVLSEYRGRRTNPKPGFVRMGEPEIQIARGEDRPPEKAKAINHS